MYAEGDNLFVFEKRNNEWRITEWHDEAFSDEEIRIANNLWFPLSFERMSVRIFNDIEINTEQQPATTAQATLRGGTSSL